MYAECVHNLPMLFFCFFISSLNLIWMEVAKALNATSSPSEPTHYTVTHLHNLKFNIIHNSHTQDIWMVPFLHFPIKFLKIEFYPVYVRDRMSQQWWRWWRQRQQCCVSEQSKTIQYSIYSRVFLDVFVARRTWDTVKYDGFPIPSWPAYLALLSLWELNRS